MFEVKWSGCFPTLCFGEWVIYKNGENMSDLIPKELRHSEMNTSGTYSEWHFENWMEVWDEYKDGLECAEWIKDNPWISALCDNNEEKEELFFAIQEQDWRHGSCGGCI